MPLLTISITISCRHTFRPLHTRPESILRTKQHIASVGCEPSPSHHERPNAFRAHLLGRLKKHTYYAKCLLWVRSIINCQKQGLLFAYNNRPRKGSTTTGATIQILETRAPLPAQSGTLLRLAHAIKLHAAESARSTCLHGVRYFNNHRTQKPLIPHHQQSNRSFCAHSNEQE